MRDCLNCAHPLSGHREPQRHLCLRYEDRRRRCVDCPACADQKAEVGV